MEPRQSSPAKTLLHSFLLVSGAYILSLVALFGCGFVLLALGYPQSFSHVEPLFGPMTEVDQEKFKVLLASDPELIFPRSFLAILMVLNALVSFVLGYLIARLSPVGKFAHGVFLAIILFVNFFQFAIGADASLQTMLVLFMATAPISVLLGARFYLGRATAPIK